MSEFEPHLEVYCSHNHSSFSKIVSHADWGDRIRAEKYLEKYWLYESEYLNKWKPIQDKIFIQDSSFPDIIYHSHFALWAFRGGCLFSESNFLIFQQFIKSIGGDSFVVIQKSNEFTSSDPMFRFIFPLTISWNELSSGNYISAVLLDMPYNEYYVFGNSTNWGKYIANDYKYPLDLYGFDKKYMNVFKEIFNANSANIEELIDFMPSAYKTLIKQSAILL